MRVELEEVVLRRPEPRDLDALWRQKNDPEVADALGGFSFGYARADLVDWLEAHRKKRDEVLWVIAGATDDACLGHVGLYQIDSRVRVAELAIMIGDGAARGRGLGKRVCGWVVRYGFDYLNLNRIQLSLLATNQRAARLYQSLGFSEEGRMRQAQFKGGQYVDVITMGLLRSEWGDAR